MTPGAAPAPGINPAPDSAERAMLDRQQDALVGLAVDSLRHGLVHDRAPELSLDGIAPEIAAPRATFVTLERNGRLRGCIGSLMPSRPLAADIIGNAFRAGFRDPRFPPLSRGEGHDLMLSISVLTPMEALRFTGESDLLQQIAPGLHGLVIADGDRRSVFLPQVWEQLPEPRDFLDRLRQKAGLPPGYWSDALEAWRFEVNKVPGTGMAPAPLDSGGRGARRVNRWRALRRY